MRVGRKTGKIVLALFLAALLGFCACALGEETEEVYIENAWNYVDGAMDVSGGIPLNAGGTLEKIRAAGKVRVAIDPYFPPQEFIDPALAGQARFVGADIELAKRVAARMGVELEIVAMEFTQVLPAVAEGECDLAISALSYTPGRAEKVTFSKGYYYSEAPGCGVMIRVDDRDEIQSVDDLKNKTLVAMSGTLQEAMMAENVLYYKEFQRVSSTLDVYGAVQEGLADAAAVDVETAQAYILAHPRCGLMLVDGIRFELEDQFTGDRIAGPKGDLALMYFVNGVINEVAEAGQYQQWYKEAEAYAARLEEENP